MMAEVPDQFVDYMVMQKIAPDFIFGEILLQQDEEDPETFLNNYFS